MIEQKDIIPVFVEMMPDILEEAKLYVSKKFMIAIHNCMCGCGERTVTPLTYTDEKLPENKLKWQLIENGDLVSLNPSIGNHHFPCKSHYTITGNIANFHKDEPR